jgi:transposase
MAMQFTEGFKETIVKKLLTPGGKGATELSKEIGVSKQTLYNWRDKYSDGVQIVQQQMSPQKWKIKDKYSAVIESANLSEKELGRWLRETELHDEHIELWKKEIEDSEKS